MPLVSIKEMLNNALKRKYAVGQFNINSLEFAQAFLQAAKEENSPVILGITEVAAENMGGVKLIALMVQELIEKYQVQVPVALHFDHSSSYEKCVEAMYVGFSSVMIDGSHHPLEQNIALTQKVVDVAKVLGVSVEAEMGRITGEEDGIVVDECEGTYAVPKECEKFVRETGVDCFAPAIGTVHGPYKGEPNLRFDLLAEIMQRTGVPLALHGGTDIPNDYIKKAISLGIAKINVNTENQIVFATAVRKVLTEQPDLYDLRKYVGSAREAVKDSVKRKMREFGSSGQA
ncbi:class II fructose-1,6-bisphosphate aldolase [Effusibacillus consociatus]|uniref:Class II fructose-1,6-bisphosphate aldolase n=1 Tax=Effusibacillus consociatus TaxID=1117041 RepID=A0ABV9Q278_9BACL